ncbi:MAG: 2,3,4,5-tetrahydropyridine-2-carboxylate N-succinyltransferase [Candidatus Deianiraeaceae bacterium]|jgi:2,3,4,5-tetrahydropyridine-2-carboxylate N-succinyltransferase
MEASSKISEYYQEMQGKVIRYTAKITEEINSVVADIDSGKRRVANKIDESWVVDGDAKKAILLYMHMMKVSTISCPLDSYISMGRTSSVHNDYGVLEKQSNDSIKHQIRWYDKIPLKTSSWKNKDFENAGFRAVPGSFVRYGSFIGSNVVLMPSFVNIGSYVGSGTMVDTWATIGSCAQIGQNCHISGGVGIGGVLEPLQANPVIIGDGCFIGARSEIAEGVIIEDGAVIGMGVYIGKSTKIIDRSTGKVSYGTVPKNSVIVSGSAPSTGGVSLYAAIIVKQVDDQTRSKTSINELLRE